MPVCFRVSSTREVLIAEKGEIQHSYNVDIPVTSQEGVAEGKHKVAVFFVVVKPVVGIVKVGRNLSVEVDVRLKRFRDHQVDIRLLLGNSLAQLDFTLVSVKFEKSPE